MDNETFKNPSSPFRITVAFLWCGLIQDGIQSGKWHRSLKKPLLKQGGYPQHEMEGKNFESQNSEIPWTELTVY